MVCVFSPKMVVLFVVAIIAVYFVISGSVLTFLMLESFTNSDADSFKGEISSCVDIDNCLSNGRTAVVALHANWCGHCKNLVPEWNKFYDLKVSGVDAFAIDHGAGKDHVVSDFKNKFGFQSKGFPTIIKLNKANESYKIQEFEGSRTAESLKSFCVN